MVPQISQFHGFSLAESHGGSLTAMGPGRSQGLTVPPSSRGMGDRETKRPATTHRPKVSHETMRPKGSSNGGKGSE